MSYWDTVLGTPSAPRTAPVPVGPYNQPINYQPTPQQYAQPAPQGYQNQHGYAIDFVQQQGAEMAQHILEEGFIKQPPSWIRQQAHDRCPNCNGANFAQLSGAGASGQYGGQVNMGKMGRHTFKRCFNCGYSASDIHQGAMNQYTGQHSNGPVVGHARQTPTGGASIRNFGEILV